ncbi:MAG: histidinol dehydrogenase [Magnetococcus sp. DMHC-6]
MNRLDFVQEDFEQRFQKILHWDEENLSEVEKNVAAILLKIRQQGDAALLQFTQQFDHLALTPQTMRVTQAEIDQAWDAITITQQEALRLAAERIRAYHSWQMPPMGIRQFEDPSGTLLGERLTPLQRVGLYVPGGKASYPSSVLMNAIPARVAGVQELIMVAPTPDGLCNPMVLAAAKLAEVDQVYRIGGAQAIAALAYGTHTIPKVDKIVGPGNIYVATAKRQLFGQVGIDMIAGPSEILVIADKHNKPAWIAADLLSQAEHDADARSILITNHPPLAEAVLAAMETFLLDLKRSDICRAALAKRGVIILVPDLHEACCLASQIAPEHLELSVANPDTFLPHIHNAGAIFMGRYTPEAMGDYVAGPNHVLPTAGTARFSSPLGVFDFIKRTSLIRCTAASILTTGPAAATLADSEGLTAHQLSILLRLKEKS